MSDKFKYNRETGTVVIPTDDDMRRPAIGSIKKVLNILIDHLEKGYYWGGEDNKGFIIHFPFTITVNARTDGLGICANVEATLEADGEWTKESGIRVKFDDTVCKL